MVAGSTRVTLTGDAHATKASESQAASRARADHGSQAQEPKPTARRATLSKERPCRPLRAGAHFTGSMPPECARFEAAGIGLWS
jgi:hypothetical protein